MMDAFFEYSREIDERLYAIYSVDNITFAHFHSNIEIVYCISGEIDITINGHTKRLTAGCVSIAGSYDIHFYSSTKSEVYVIIIPLSIVKSFSSVARGYSFKSPFLDKCNESEEIRHISEQLMNDGIAKDLLTSKGYAYAILGILYRKIGMKHGSKTSDVELARKILIYIQDQYLENISIKRLSGKIGYNSDYLSRFINMYLGSGFNSIVNTLRVKYAAQLMSENNASITSIALQSGFNNTRTFNRAFYAVYKTTPTKYRKNLTGAMI